MRVRALLLFLFLVSGVFSKLKAQEQTDSAKIVAINSDEDWRTIVAIHLEFMDKLVAAENLEEVDFNDEEAFLNLIDMTRNEYDRKRGIVRSAATRLIEKFRIESDCPPCSLTATESTQKLKDLAIFYQTDPETYLSYKMAMENLGGLGGGLSSSCCSWRFYACCAVCAGTIEAFPIYLACCSLCFDSYCCKPKKQKYD